jgi:hypothetical protein
LYQSSPIREFRSFFLVNFFAVTENLVKQKKTVFWSKLQLKNTQVILGDVDVNNVFWQIAGSVSWWNKERRWRASFWSRTTLCL